MTLRSEDSLAGRDAADLRIGERAHQFVQRVRGPNRVGIDQDADLTRGLLDADPQRIAFPGDLGPRHVDTVVVRADRFERRVLWPVDHHMDFVGLLGGDSVEHVAEEIFGFVHHRD